MKLHFPPHRIQQRDGGIDQRTENAVRVLDAEAVELGEDVGLLLRAGLDSAPVELFGIHDGAVNGGQDAHGAVGLDIALAPAVGHDARGCGQNSDNHPRDPIHSLILLCVAAAKGLFDDAFEQKPAAFQANDRIGRFNQLYLLAARDQEADILRDGKQHNVNRDEPQRNHGEALHSGFGSGGANLFVRHFYSIYLTQRSVVGCPHSCYTTNRR